MASSATATSPPSKPKRLGGEYILPPLLFFAAMMMGADFTAIETARLRALQVPYPGALDFAHFIIPGASAVLWLALLRWWPKSAAILAVVICFMLIGTVPRYAKMRVATIAMPHELDSAEFTALQSRLGFHAIQQDQPLGAIVMVATEHEQALRTELARLGVFSAAQRSTTTALHGPMQYDHFHGVGPDNIHTPTTGPTTGPVDDSALLPTTDQK